MFKKTKCISRIKFLSHTVDPINDTPERLLEYVNDLKSKNIDINYHLIGILLRIKEDLYDIAKSYFINVGADSLAPGGLHILSLCFN